MQTMFQVSVWVETLRSISTEVVVVRRSMVDRVQGSSLEAVWVLWVAAQSHPNPYATNSRQAMANWTTPHSISIFGDQIEIGVLRSTEARCRSPYNAALT